MTVRAHFERKLNELNDEILRMGRLVEDELKLAMEAFNELDEAKAKAVSTADRVVNRTRFDIEEKCFSLIVTQQPAAIARHQRIAPRIWAHGRSRQPGQSSQWWRAFARPRPTRPNWRS